MKHVLRLLSVILFIAVIMSLSAYAAEESSMILTYAKEHVVFSDLEIDIYRIADRNFDKLSPYDSYPVEVKGIISQTEWNGVAVTLSGYITADSVEPYMTAKTDSEGSVVFDGLEQGLYLVAGVRTEVGGKIYTFYDFMILVTEDVTAIPKAGISEPSDEEKIYSILKLWKKDDPNSRPNSVTVDILKDGEFYKTVILDYINDWSYSFKSDSDSVWHVVERNVPEDYYVQVTEKSTAFIITNIEYDKNPDDGRPGEDITADSGSNTTKPDSDTGNPGYNPPQTGDTFPMKRYMIMLCVSGMLLVILGLGMRRKDDAKSR